MRHLALAAHLGRTVQVDHCSGCRLVWFDTLESVNLAAQGWLALLRELQVGSGLVLADALHAEPACPRCRAGLKPVRNRTRYGAFAAFECPAGHGHLHTHSGVLAERGLVRPLAPAERDALQRGQRELACVNCGAPADGRAESCRWCASPIVVIDLPRLMHALTRGLTDDAPAPRASGRAVEWRCVACGHALDPGREAACGACGTAALAPSLPEVEPLLDAAEAQLKLPRPAPSAPPDRRRAREARPGGWRETTLYRLHEWWREDGSTPPRSLEAMLWQWFVDLPAPWRWGAAALLGLLVWWWA